LTGLEPAEAAAEKLLEKLEERHVRYLILSDIHSNDEALTEVLALRPPPRSSTRVVVLGDSRRYGGQSNQIVERIRKIKREKIMIRGNHDKVVVGTESEISSIRARSRRPRVDGSA